MARKTHKDLEFHVNRMGGFEQGKGSAHIFKHFSEAAALAVAHSLQMDGKFVNVDVICWSEGAARVWMGDEGVEQYRSDPEASVFQRFIIKAQDEGQIA